MTSGKRVPKVSVCVITYNHEPFIGQCLQSILDQETDFDFEVIVGEDASADRTREIVLAFQARYPERVRVIAHERNVGGVQNYIDVHNAARGAYIAHVDGDDYILPGKLQLQAAKLDSDPDCNIVWHRMKVLDTVTGECRDDLVEPSWIDRRKFVRDDVLALMTIGLHSSTMYRASRRDFPLPPFDIIDYLIAAEQVGTGVACFVGDQPLGVYRVGLGLASSGTYTKRLMADSFEYLARRYPQHRASINTAALTMWLAEMKNRGPLRRRLGEAWLNTFHPASPWHFLRRWPDIRRLRLPVRPRPS